MPEDLQPLAALRWDGTRLSLLDQTQLPGREAWISCASAADVAGAVARLAVRGAPNIGIAGAYGVALEVARTADWEPGVAALRDARPTAVNLAWAVDRVAAVARAGGSDAARAAAEALHAEEDKASLAVAAAGADWLQARGATTLLTHCNTGVLACAAGGSALGCALELARRGSPVRVLVSETRPLLQGARLTAYECDRAGIDYAVLAEGAAAGLMLRGEVDAVLVGCDRVAANGDTANKVGTLTHALAARAAGIPFLVVGPTSSVDLGIDDGDAIPIEEREADELRRTPGGELLTPADAPVRNPAFDVTPAAYVTALVTERGIAEPPDAGSVARLAGDAAGAPAT